MTTSAHELNAWLATHFQDAIHDLSRQGMTLRFVDGAENYHQDHASLAVGAEGVGFTFQTNYPWQAGPIGQVNEAVERANDFQQAFAAARHQYGDKPLPMVGMLVRGERWEVCNHQVSTSDKQANAQRAHWLRHGYEDSREDMPGMVQALCARQAFYDRLRTPEGILGLVRAQDSMDYRPDEDAYAFEADPLFRLMLDHQSSDEGRVVITQALYWDDGYLRHFPLSEHTQAKLSPSGIRYTSEGFAPLTPSIDAKDLGLDPDAMEAMVSMGVSPIDLLRFDAAQAQADAVAGADYLAGLDGDLFLDNESQSNGFMR